MACGCKKKKTTPVESNSTDVKTNTQSKVEANDVDNNNLILKITNRLKEITK